MKHLRAIAASPVFHVTLLTLLVGAVFLRSRIVPMDDHFNYQRFMEALAEGRLDLSIPGFQGASFLAFPLYLFTRSPLTNALFQAGCALLLPAAGYLAASALLRDRLQAILFMYVIALSPFLMFMALRGFTFPSFTLLVLLTLWLRGRGSAWAFLPWTFSLITKPFSIALVPLFLLWRTREGRTHEGVPLTKRVARGRSPWARGWVQCLLALILPVLYVALQLTQAGRIIVGSHPEIDQSNVFAWWRAPLNAAHGLQMLFSVHNYYFPDPARTGPGNLVHSSPLLMAFGVVSLLYLRRFWKDVKLGRAIGIAAILAFVLAALLDHMDHFYMETAVLLLALASLPFIAKHLLLLPLILATFHFQFFYLYLWGRGTYFMDYSLFLIPLTVDVIALVSWILFHGTWCKGLPRRCSRFLRSFRHA